MKISKIDKKNSENNSNCIQERYKYEDLEGSLWLQGQFPIDILGAPKNSTGN